MPPLYEHKPALQNQLWNQINPGDVSHTMFCPQCGTEAQASVQYCRVCGSNLKVIGKAVSLSEAIARSDRGPVPKIREMMKNLKVEHVTEEVSRALDHMNQEIAQISAKESVKSKSREARRALRILRKKKTAAERRENHITKGIVSLFSGAGLTIFLYFLSITLILKLPPDIVGQIPFEVQSAFRSVWLLGLLPMMSGMGHILAGLLIKPDREPQPQLEEAPRRELTDRPIQNPVPMSVTDHTTNLLEQDRIPGHKKAQTTN